MLLLWDVPWPVLAWRARIQQAYSQTQDPVECVDDQTVTHMFFSKCKDNEQWRVRVVRNGDVNVDDINKGSCADAGDAPFTGTQRAESLNYWTPVKPARTASDSRLLGRDRTQICISANIMAWRLADPGA